MRLAMASAAALIVLLGLHGSSPLGARAAPKKLILFASPVAYRSPAYLREHAGELGWLPFDGLVVEPRGSSQWLWTYPRPESMYAQDRANLQATRYGRLTNNLVLLASAMEPSFDVFSDANWQAAETNLRTILKTAAAGRCVGACFDTETYNRSPWGYAQQPKRAEHTFAEYERQVRKRGAQFMRVVQEEIPHPRILCTFLLGHLATRSAGLVEAGSREPLSRRLEASDFGLLPAFLDGMLDAAATGTVIIDGNEDSYYYSQRSQFEESVDAIRRKALPLVAPEDQVKYREYVQAGQAVFVNQLLANRGDAMRTLSTFLEPQDRPRWLEHNLYQAVSTADQYAWCYSEGVDWASPDTPPGLKQATRAATRKASRGQPLGFDILPALQAADRRRLDALRKPEAPPPGKG